MSIILVCLVAFFFAMNIGASGAAASMGIAYGSGAIKRRFIALLICGTGVIFGAVLGGGEVAKTIGSEIIPEEIININIALIILSASTISLFIANLCGIPLSTSEVTVGSIVGVGVAFKALYVNSLVVIISYWLMVPIIACMLAYLVDRLIRRIERRTALGAENKWTKWLTLLVIFTGFMEAFSAGMNNVANAVGPLIAAGILEINSGVAIGGFFVALGALLMGGRVIETTGKKITELNLLQGSAVSGLGGTLVIISSLFGIPVPQTQITTCSILGIGLSRNGRQFWQKDIIGRVLKIWFVSPFFSLVMSFSLVKTFLHYDMYSVVLVLSVFVSTIGFLSLLKPKRRKSRLFKETTVLKSRREIG